VREGEEEETREGVWLFRYANANASKQDKWGCPILLLLVQNAFSPLIKLLTITGLTQVLNNHIVVFLKFRNGF
jgi:hypothetical protein